jgi:hypothetical protein
VGGLPLEAVEVRRCNEVKRGQVYEIGTRIIKRKAETAA